MSQENMFELISLIKSANGDPAAITDAVWDAGYRQPPRTEQEAAQVTIDTFFYCAALDLPSELWPNSYDNVLCNELMKAILPDDEDDAFTKDPIKVANSIVAAGFSKKLNTATTAVPDGWKLVPIEITEDMIYFIVPAMAHSEPLTHDEYDRNGRNEHFLKWLWSRLLDKAPSPEVGK